MKTRKEDEKGRREMKTRNKDEKLPGASWDAAGWVTPATAYSYKSGEILETAIRTAATAQAQVNR
jgi:hypothetical protein